VPRSDFYSAVAQASFTLLGLWWVLLQIRHADWMRDPRLRWWLYDVSLSFLLPGMMGLVSLLAVDTPAIWRVAFAAGGIVGAIESIASLGIKRAGRGMVLRVADVLSLLIYAAVAAIAIDRQLPMRVGTGLRPLDAEGVLIASLLMLGILLAAALFIHEAQVAEG
jgi:hypothetical protein